MEHRATDAQKRAAGAQQSVMEVNTKARKIVADARAQAARIVQDAHAQIAEREEELAKKLAAINTIVGG